MPETFFILLCGGVMFATAVPDPRTVTVHWLRLAGIIALSMAGLSLVFLGWRTDARSPLLWIFPSLTTFLVLAQLGLAQSVKLRPQRWAATLAAAAAVAAGVVFIPGKAASSGLHQSIVTLSAVGIAAMTGLCLMEMLLGHAYLTASKMTMKPMERLNRSLALATGLRIVSAVAGVIALQLWMPVRMLWMRYGLLIGTRWFVGLVVPAVFVYMTHDCIKRRATQSATGILYVAGVLVFIGELIALLLVRDTGLPF